MAFSVISFYLIYFTLCEYYSNSKIMLLSQSHDDGTASAVRALEILLYISRSDVWFQHPLDDEYLQVSRVMMFNSGVCVHERP